MKRGRDDTNSESPPSFDPADAPRAPSSPSRPPPSGVGQRIAVVVNGNAKSVSSEVIETLDQILDSGDLFVSRRIEDSEGIARTLVDRGYGTILTGGGDGTFTVVVTAVVKEAERRGIPIPRFGMLRLGTGNALAWVLGASRAKGQGGQGLAVDLARLRSDAGSRELCLVEAEGILSPFCGFGIDADVLSDYAAVKSAMSHGPMKRWAAGPVAYTIAATTRTIPSYAVRRKAPRCRVINEADGALRVGEKGSIIGPPIRKGEVLYEGPARIAACSTIPYYGFGFRVFPYADDRPDKMNLRLSNISPFTFVTKFRSIWRGEYDDVEVNHDFFVDDITIEMDPPTAFQIGGDGRGERTSVRIRRSQPVKIVDFYAPPSG